MARLRISARPDGNGYIDYRYNGKRIGWSVQTRRGHFVTNDGLDNFIIKHNLQSPSKPLTRGLEYALSV